MEAVGILVAVGTEQLSMGSLHFDRCSVLVDFESLDAHAVVAIDDWADFWPTVESEDFECLPEICF